MSRGQATASTTQILVVDDEAAFRTLVAGHLERAGMAVATLGSAEEALAWLEQRQPDLLLLDVHMPGMTGIELVTRLSAEQRLPPTIVMSAYGQLDTALAAVRGGAMDFLSKPFRLPEVELKVTVALEKARQRKGGRQRSGSDAPSVDRAEALGDGNALFYGMVGRSAVVRELFARIERVARFTSTVLIHGESGTGKELVARALHQLSPRRGGPFVAVNCGAIPRELLESELFGSEKGAYTGSVKTRVGLLETAAGGTLFLDEIVDLPLHLQVKLLRVLQEGEVRPVGASRPVTVDVRVVAASAVPARDRVTEGLFRQDLYYRLSVIELLVPPLRDRREDIPLLVEHLISHANRRLGTTIRGVHPHAMALLMAWPWPGNIRELQNVIEQSAVMSEDDEVGEDALPRYLHADAAPQVAPAPAPTGLTLESLSIPAAVEQTERTLIEQALRETGGNRTHAAELLEISLRSLLQKIARYEIDIPGQVGRPPQR